MHVVGEDAGAVGRAMALSSSLVKVVAVVDVVAQDQRAGVAADEITSQDEGLGQPIRTGLHAVLDACPSGCRRPAGLEAGMSCGVEISSTRGSRQHQGC